MSMISICVFNISKTTCGDRNTTMHECLAWYPGVGQQQHRVVKTRTANHYQKYSKSTSNHFNPNPKFYDPQQRHGATGGLDVPNQKPLPISANASAQTDACSRMSDTDAQTDVELTPIMGWDTRDVETQTPVDEGFDSLDRILAKSGSVLDDAQQVPIRPLSDELEEQDSREDLLRNSAKMLSMESQTEPVNKGAVGAGIAANKHNAHKLSISAKENNQEIMSEAARPYVVETFWESLERQLGESRPSSARNLHYPKYLGEAYKLLSELLLDNMLKNMEQRCQSCTTKSQGCQHSGQRGGRRALHERTTLALRPPGERAGHCTFRGHPLSKDIVQDNLTRLLMDVEGSLGKHAVLDYALKMNLREIGVQTDNDPITDEAPEYAARPPPCKKQEMIPDMSVFEEIDKHAIEVSLYKYDWKYMDVKLGADQVLVQGEGVCKRLLQTLW
ncbi:TGc domain-containing protein [Caerostris extrusa]|uniref:TGc domain-containing protein n=1 Tax=Caerostris extrusa TaxID=172846 RepID=A0AAV4PSK1_CAEEX|nr:TGc domain-containing protein [Caerostris extrusa]